uniref:Uncharacterized protein n=1 Tax=Arundo donax TaxID=35708 RepID=A0A0A9F307_ARUDO
MQTFVVSYILLSPLSESRKFSSVASETEYLEITLKSGCTGKQCPAR